MKVKKFITFFLLLIFIFTAFSTGFIINDRVTAAANEGDYEVTLIRLSGGNYGLPSPYVHYARGPGIYKMNLIFDSLLERGEEGLVADCYKGIS